MSVDTLPHQEHEARIAVLEVEMQHIKEEHTNTRMWLSSIDGKVDDIRSRMDKQNGAIPHIQDDIKKFGESLEKLHNKTEQISTTASTTKFKTGILWAGLGMVSTAILTFLIQRFLK
jgi:peptidoglycan hydrolase CwlO-like protein